MKTVDRSVEWQQGIKFDQDIDMPKIAAMAGRYRVANMKATATIPSLFVMVSLQKLISRRE